MEIRFATAADTLSIIRAIQNKHMDYNTTTQAKEDVKLGRLVVAEENGKLLGSCAIVKDERRGYTAIKRVCVYSSKSRGKGVAQSLVGFVCSLGLGTLGATPWNDNPAMCHIFKKFGFEYQYTFLKYYDFYKKRA
jgi:RimJ/RimL family protein N-acetyltransferase